MRLRQAFSVAVFNFRQWHKNPRIIITFCLAFVLCFLLSDKAVRFAVEYKTSMQVVEPFIWTFGDSNSILLSSLLLVLLFADIPFISSGTPFYLMRMNRKTWVSGQAIYIIAATLFYLVFILAATTILCLKQSFIGNLWSNTAAILAYSGAGKAVALPALVKTLEMSRPYQCMINILLLMLLYSLLMAFVMLVFTLIKGQLAGIVSVFAFSLYGFLLNAQTVKLVLLLPDRLMYWANVAVGWISPLNQATYPMHNFGYDLLPRIWQTFVIDLIFIALCWVLSLRAVRGLNFSFTGTEG